MNSGAWTLGLGLWDLDSGTWTMGARDLFVDDRSDFEGEFLRRAEDRHRVGFIGWELFDDASEVFGGKDSLFGDFEDHVIDFQSRV